MYSTVLRQFKSYCPGGLRQLFLQTAHQPSSLTALLIFGGTKGIYYIYYFTASQTTKMMTKPLLSGIAKLRVDRGVPVSTLSFLNMNGGATGLVDLTNEAAGFFINLRIPATLLVGASLGVLFAGSVSKEAMKTRPKLERECIRCYNSCIFLSFVLALTTSAFATAASVKIMHADFNPLAESAYALLCREFEFEFITTRLSYLSSLMAFMVGITSRAFVEYNLLDSERRDEFYVLCFGMMAIVTHLGSYINSTLYSSQNLLGMAFTLARIVVERAFLEHRPLQILSLGCSAVMTFFLTRVLFFKRKGKPEDLFL